MYVYKTTNLLNNKIYIGICTKSSSLSERYLGSGKALKAAIKKYNRKNFKKEIIIEDSTFKYSDLQFLEIFYIEFYDSQNPSIGYNISRGGDGNVGETNGMYGKNHTEETKSKISESRLKNILFNPEYGKMSKEAKLNFSNFLSERNKSNPTLPSGHSEETKLRISNTLIEKFKNGEIKRNYAKFTKERKLEWSEKFSGENNPFFGKKHSEETKNKIKENIRLRFPPVNMLDINDNIIKTYDSITDVTIDSYRPDLVKKVIKGENKLHGGYKWKLCNTK